MHYILIVFLTFIQTILVNSMMGLSVCEVSPFTIRLWCNYLAASIILWSPLLFTNKRRWTYVVSILLDIWFIGNLIYYRSYGDVLNRWCLQNVGNMDGIWSSILPFCQLQDIVFPVLTLLWIFFSEAISCRRFLSLWKRVGLAALVFFLLCIPQANKRNKAVASLTPFSAYYADLSMGRMWYMHTFGALTHFGNEVFNLAFRNEAPVDPISPDEIAPYLQSKGTNMTTTNNILFVFFESLEYRTIGMAWHGHEVTPNMNRLIAYHNTACYPVQAQVKEGKSSDAQLITMTGLLPIRNGAVSMRYATNKFPSWIKAVEAPTKQIFTPCSPQMWNQVMIARAWGLDSLYAKYVSDLQLVHEVEHSIASSERPFVMLMTTMASHSPFTQYADTSKLPVDPQLAIDEQNYLKSVHYTDSALGVLINTILSDSVLAANTRIIITGDHPAFHVETPVPLIIYDPFIAPQEARRTLYQMDIYTTLVERMKLNTEWHGLGRNVADTSAYTPDEIRQMEALSDRIIRTDYFHQTP